MLKRQIYKTDGPGEVYHIDGNDKLKRWGFAIHGCVDGFNLKIMWFVVATSNNDPLHKHGFCPKLLRMDRGNENIYCEDLQVFLTGNDDSYLYAASTRNQRIEAFWSGLKRFKTEWWIQLFSGMVKDSVYKPQSNIHQEALLFCFRPVLQCELNEFMRTWNARNVRQSAEAPGRKPYILFYLPSLIAYTNQGIKVKQIDISIGQDTVGFGYHPVFKDEDLHELFLCYVGIHQLVLPNRC